MCDSCVVTWSVHHLCCICAAGNFRWIHDGVFVDKDGSLTDSSAGSKVLVGSTALPQDCADSASFSRGAADAVICPPSTKFFRFAFNK